MSRSITVQQFQSLTGTVFFSTRRNPDPVHVSLKWRLIYSYIFLLFCHIPHNYIYDTTITVLSSPVALRKFQKNKIKINKDLEIYSPALVISGPLVYWISLSIH